MKKPIAIIVVFFAALLAPGAAQAANGDFDSRATGNWNATSTWIKQLSGTASFNSASTAVTGAGTSFTTQLVIGDVLMLQSSSGTVQGTVASITNNTNLTLTANAATTASGAYGKQATPTSADDLITILNGHTVTVTAAVTVDQVTVNAGAHVIVNSGITWTVANGGGDDLIVNGTVTVAGTITGPNAVTINSGGAVTVAGAMNLTTGNPTLTVSGTLTVDGSVSGPNLVTVSSGGLLTVSSTGTLNPTAGNPTVAVTGTMDVAGTLTGPNAITINSGGIVNVTGIMNLTDGNRLLP